MLGYNSVTIGRTFSWRETPAVRYPHCLIAARVCLDRAGKTIVWVRRLVTGAPPHEDVGSSKLGRSLADCVDGETARRHAGPWSCAVTEWDFILDFSQLLPGSSLIGVICGVAGSAFIAVDWVRFSLISPNLLYPAKSPVRCPYDPTQTSIPP